MSGYKATATVPVAFEGHDYVLEVTGVIQDPEPDVGITSVWVEDAEIVSILREDDDDEVEITGQEFLHLAKDLFQTYTDEIEEALIENS